MVMLVILSGAVRQWQLPELPAVAIDPILASYAFLGKDQIPPAQVQVQ